jgi:hypothetical protein
MAGVVGLGSKTLETGAGVSTVLFAGWGCEHICVVPGKKQPEAVLDYCRQSGIDTTSLSFVSQASEFALPELSRDTLLDLVFIDGNHGFPTPIIDWFYGASHLRQGGVVVFDDLQLPQVSHWLRWFLDRDPRWEHLSSTAKWAAYRRHSSGQLSELSTNQNFLAPETKPQLMHGVHEIMAWGKFRLSKLVSYIRDSRS